MSKNQSTHLRHSKMSVRELLLLVEILCYNYAICNHWEKIGKRKKGANKGEFDGGDSHGYYYPKYSKIL